jgi:hypothetical protein
MGKVGLGGSEAEIVEKFLHGRVVEGFGEKRVPEECAELSLASKILEFRVVNDDGARVGASGLRVDDRLER